MLLPQLTIQVPAATAFAAAFWYLFARAYPGVPMEPASRLLEEMPPTLSFWIAVASASYWLFLLVAFAAGTTAAASLARRTPISLSAALDPGFTRMGSLLAVGFTLYAIAIIGSVLVITVVGTIGAIYVALRFGLVIPAMLLEGLTVGASFRRSWGLLRKRMLGYLGMLASLLPLTLAAFTTAVIIMAIAAAPFSSDDPSRAAYVRLNAFIVFVTGMVMVPILAFWSAALTLYFLRLKEESRD